MRQQEENLPSQIMKIKPTEFRWKGFQPAYMIQSSQKVTLN